MLFKNKKMIATICVAVLIFPGHAAAMTSPLCSTNNKRKPVTANSRQTMIETTQPGALSNSTSMIKAVMTSILSANGSANFPKLVTRPLERAILPSSQSVMLAAAKRIAAIRCVFSNCVVPTVSVPRSIGKTKTKIKMGIIMIRNTVN